MVFVGCRKPPPVFDTSCLSLNYLLRPTRKLLSTMPELMFFTVAELAFEIPIDALLFSVCC